MKPKGVQSGGHGLGHMSDVPVSAFDLIFRLHHCNSDRLLATWQCLNWKAWFDKVCYKQNVTKVEDKKKGDPLLPFHRIGTDIPATGYWTSDPISRTSIPGQKHCAAIFNNNKKVENVDFFGPTSTENETWNDYVINVIYDRYALGGSSYSIQLWLGGDGENSDTTFRDEENLIGQVYSFAGMDPSEGGCSNCASQKGKGVLFRAQVLLTIRIVPQALDHRFRHIKTTRIDDERPTKDFRHTTFSVFRGTGKPRTTPDDADMALPPIYVGNKILPEVTEKSSCGVTSKYKLLGISQVMNFRMFSD
ncbi:Tyosinase, C-terminal [Fusarium oxysporum f. sp. vasinfectum]|nr:Tyosinase, C-terminal [Fusarium oxysporum f. sp. vasinfectum]